MLIFGGSLTPEIIIGVLVGVLIGMTVHEFAHNYVAHLMGDPVPQREGRLTLDPSVHIYWPGFIMFVLIGFGVLGTAPISANRMRNPRWGYLAAVAAGPLSNLLVAIVFAIPIRILGGALPDPVADLLFYIVVFNVLLFIFNLIPLFPIDGWHMVYALLPPDLAYSWQRNAQTTQYIFMGLLIVSLAVSYLRLPFPSPFGLIIGEPLTFIIRLLLGA